MGPRPGVRPGGGGCAPNYLVPDVRVFKVGGDFLVRVSDDGLPRLRVSPYYRQILRDRGARPEAVAFAQAKVTTAQRFIKSIYERQRTIQKVTEAIVRRQRDFFEAARGPGAHVLFRDRHPGSARQRGRAGSGEGDDPPHPSPVRVPAGPRAISSSSAVCRVNTA
ncbi:MAG: hypothetical protein ACRELZ_09500 [Candidatus Rokuibacteriota bacterium]